MPFLTVMTALAALSLVRGLLGAGLGWFGVTLATLPVILLIGRAMILNNVSRTSVRLYGILTLGAAGVLFSLWWMFQSGSHLPIGLALVAFCLLLLYVLWYSHLDRGPNATLATGRPLPEFVYETESGEAVSSREFLGHPALFIFYRGNWCPLCMSQIKELAGRYQALARRGVQVVLISPQPHGHTRKLARQYEVPFHFLVDPDNRAARRLEIIAEGGLPAGLALMGYDRDTVFPTAILTDAEGLVLVAHQTDNYLIRPDPDTFLRVLDARESTI